MDVCRDLVAMKDQANQELSFFRDDQTLADRSVWVQEREDVVFKKMATFFNADLMTKHAQSVEDGVSLYICYIGPHTFEKMYEDDLDHFGHFDQYVYIEPKKVPAGMLTEELHNDRKIRGAAILAEIQIEISLTRTQDMRGKKLLLLKSPKGVAVPHFDDEKQARKFMARTNLPSVSKDESAMNMLNGIIESIKGMSPAEQERIARMTPPGYQHLSLNKAVRFCFTCKKSSVTAKLCGRCKTIYYCSRECQGRDWGRHKKECGKKSS